MTTRPRTTVRPLDDVHARSRLSLYKRWLADGELEVQPDPRDLEASSRYWRRKAALAHLNSLTAGPKRKS